MVQLNDKKGFVDKTGKAVVPIIYMEALYFMEGLADVRLDGDSGKSLVDGKGKLIFPFYRYDDVESFGYGLAKVKSNNKYGYIGACKIDCVTAFL